MECLLYSDEQLRQHCQGLNDKERQDLYYQVLARAKEAILSTQKILQMKI